LIFNQSFKSIDSKIDLILNSEKFTLTHSSSGCYHSWTRTYNFEKRSNEISVTDEYSQKIDKNKRTVIKFQLTENEFNGLKTIIKNGANHKKIGVCTTTEKFEISNGRFTVSFAIEDCQFDDFKNWINKYENK
jgi:RecA-family ATPase